MNISGTITLLSAKKQEIVSRRYRNPKERSDIIQNWKYTYGKMFNSMGYQISPNVAEERFSLEQIEEMVRLKDLGKSYYQIGKRFDISHVTARNYIIKAKIKQLKAA